MEENYIGTCRFCGQICGIASRPKTTYFHVCSKDGKTWTNKNSTYSDVFKGVIEASKRPQPAVLIDIDIF